MYQREAPVFIYFSCSLAGILFSICQHMMCFSLCFSLNTQHSTDFQFLLTKIILFLYRPALTSPQLLPLTSEQNKHQTDGCWALSGLSTAKGETCSCSENNIFTHAFFGFRCFSDQHLLSSPLLSPLRTSHSSGFNLLLLLVNAVSCQWPASHSEAVTIQTVAFPCVACT